MNKFNTQDFLEPTEKYINEWLDSPHIDDIKLWFNADIIHFVYYFKKPKEYNELIANFSNFLNHYDITLTSEELIERFQGYPEEDFNELVGYLIKKECDAQNLIHFDKSK